ncbi:MAG: hypothetical protein JWN79_43 [Gemmatimonadetes bacterium]|nr:hypothetical protein [Gemmatimonadota bacterium]
MWHRGLRGPWPSALHSSPHLSTVASLHNTSYTYYLSAAEPASGAVMSASPTPSYRFTAEDAEGAEDVPLRTHPDGPVPTECTELAEHCRIISSAARPSARREVIRQFSFRSGAFGPNRRLVWPARAAVLRVLRALRGESRSPSTALRTASLLRLESGNDKGTAIAVPRPDSSHPQTRLARTSRRAVQLRAAPAASSPSRTRASAAIAGVSCWAASASNTFRASALRPAVMYA